MSENYKRKRIIKKEDGINEGKNYRAYLAEAKKTHPALYGGYRADGTVDTLLWGGIERDKRRPKVKWST